MLRRRNDDGIIRTSGVFYKTNACLKSGLAVWGVFSIPECYIISGLIADYAEGTQYK